MTWVSSDIILKMYLPYTIWFVVCIDMHNVCVLLDECVFFYICISICVYIFIHAYLCSLCIKIFQPIFVFFFIVTAASYIYWSMTSLYAHIYTIISLYPYNFSSFKKQGWYICFYDWKNWFSPLCFNYKLTRTHIITPPL